MILKFKLDAKRFLPNELEQILASIIKQLTKFLVVNRTRFYILFSSIWFELIILWLV